MTTRVPSVATRVFVRCVTIAVVLAAFAMLSSEMANAQQPTRKPRTQAPRSSTIEIRGQVPTPQVVTVRPRETPAYSRRVLVPGFFDRDFWPSILPPLDIVSARPGTRSDTTSRSTTDSTARPPSPPRSPSGTPPAPLRR
ncbi:MAG TPA: hypothetical protein VFW03_06810 [Gemmatimonadaceae bacterium]|nr:hypothetical protein [Gemmatimonadaceae bacterium]